MDMREDALTVTAEFSGGTIEKLEGPMAVCMGAAACERVCSYVGDPALETAADPTIPLEKTCAVLEDTESLDADNIGALKELLSSTLLPEIDGMTSAEVVHEATETISQLQAEQTAFDDYLSSVLKREPRFVLDEKRKAYTEASKEPAFSEGLTDEEVSARRLVRNQARAFYDLHTLENEGVLYDTSSREIMSEMAQKIALGYHVSLSGEPGIAKTTLAKHVARLNTAAHNPGGQVEPLVLSFSSTSEAEAQVSEQTFEDGTLGQELGRIAKAMQEGQGVVLDEYNGITADQSIFLNDLLLKKPGDVVKIAGKNVTIKEGFVAIATLNPMTDTQGSRRHGRQQQDSAGAARFERVDVHLPGAPGYWGDAKETMRRLAMANWANNYGWRIPDASQLHTLTQLSEFTTELAEKATKPHEDGSGHSDLAKRIPLIAECITPRDLSRILASTMSYASPSEVGYAIRSAIAERTKQIIHSNNGHILSSKAIDVVEELQRRHNFGA